MKTFFAMLTVLVSLAAGQASAQEFNQYCDPVGTMYLGGTPLFNELSGEYLSLEEYLARKGVDSSCNPIEAEVPVVEELNQYCDPVGTMYLGGSPLFDERTGKRISLQEYLARKGVDSSCNPIEAEVPVVEELNQYCDPVGTMYLGGNPLFDERTGKFLSLDEYLARKGLNRACEEI